MTCRASFSLFTHVQIHDNNGITVKVGQSKLDEACVGLRLTALGQNSKVNATKPPVLNPIPSELRCGNRELAASFSSQLSLFPNKRSRPRVSRP